MCDRRRVVQVVLNLVTNAAKYNRKGNLVQLVGRAEGNHAIVEVIDDGPGIAPSDVSRLFTPFDRLGKERQKGVEGSGLGLALSKRLIESMKGEIGFEMNRSERGGSTFWFSLPCPNGTETTVSGPVTEVETT